MKKTALNLVMIIAIIASFTACNQSMYDENKANVSDNNAALKEGDISLVEYSKESYTLQNPSFDMDIKKSEMLNSDYHFTTHLNKEQKAKGSLVKTIIEKGHQKFLFNNKSNDLAISRGVKLVSSFLCDNHGFVLKDENASQMKQLNVKKDTKIEINMKQPMIFINKPEIT